jgi:nuclear-control-of-ATPase protein 2
MDWVLDPLTNILKTIQHGDSSLNLMPKESLKSDLDSLERMVVEFGRDEYKMGDEELRLLGEKVRQGDLTSVLKVWEQDIKVCFFDFFVISGGSCASRQLTRKNKLY